MKQPNQAAPVNAPVALRFHVGQPWRRVTEQQRWLLDTAIATLFVLALSVIVNGQGAGKGYRVEYEHYCQRVWDAEWGFRGTNVYAEMRSNLISCGVTNLTETDLRQDPQLYRKQMLRVMFLPGLQRSAEERGVSNVYSEMRTNLLAKGFTNITEAELRLDLGLFVWAWSRIHAALPASPLDWPPPETNRMEHVVKFIEQNGWSMPERSAFDVMTGSGTKPLTGLPWPVITDRTFNAYTSEHWLVVILRGPTSFGPEEYGLLWSPGTGRPPFASLKTKPLGEGWYGFVYP